MNSSLSLNKMKKTQELNEEKWVHDNISIDYKGRVPLRASTGAWKASAFLIVISFCQNVCYYGIASNLYIYILNVIHEDWNKFLKNVVVQRGVSITMSVIGGFVADAYLGQFITVVLSSLVCLLGMILLTMTRVVPGLGPGNTKSCEDPNICKEPQQTLGNVFLFGFMLIALGMGGLGPCMESFGADQFDDNHPTERKHKFSFFNWWNIGSFSGNLFGTTIIAYIRDSTRWFYANVTVISIMASTLVILCLGRPFYRFKKTKRSPLTPMFQVIVAAFAKRKLTFPSEGVMPINYLYEPPSSRTSKQRLLCHTNNLKFLDKAAIIEDIHTPTEEQNPWLLSSVTKVEEAKLVVSMILIWLTYLPFYMCVAQVKYLSSFIAEFLKPLEHYNVNVPWLPVNSFDVVGSIISLTLYDKLLVPILRRKTRVESGISILQRIGIGMTISLVGVIIAAMVETKRLNVVENSPVKVSFTMSQYWIAPQFLLMGVGEGLSLVGLQEYFYSQAPDSMRSFGIAFYFTLIGVGAFSDILRNKLIDLAQKKLHYAFASFCLKDSHFDLI